MQRVNLLLTTFCANCVFFAYKNQILTTLSHDCDIKHTCIFYYLGKSHNFRKMKSNTRGLKYDYGSVMHYRANSFSRNGKPTITTLKSASIGQRRGLSRTDWMHVKKNYCRKSGWWWWH